ncbi:hypothetical protein J4E08_02945 [Sagittula sp. NFXS13]|uniref:Uncharacterized protein n=1 Tax=Sagittula marina TaxID=943940 RepID=A0A7W6DKZ2_9RHOB|nr:hypothetical protein [Sagittula marina]
MSIASTLRRAANSFARSKSHKRAAPRGRQSTQSQLARMATRFLKKKT